VNGFLLDVQLTSVLWCLYPKEACYQFKEEDLPGLDKEIKEKMHKDVTIRPAITWLKANTLERATKKTQLLDKVSEKK
jgi:hypothetical protein